MNAFDFENLDVYKAAIEWVSGWPTARDLLMRVVSMLVPMIQRTGDSGTGAGTK